MLGSDCGLGGCALGFVGGFELLGCGRGAKRKNVLAEVCRRCRCSKKHLTRRPEPPWSGNFG